MLLCGHPQPEGVMDVLCVQDRVQHLHNVVQRQVAVLHQHPIPFLEAAGHDAPSVDLLALAHGDAAALCKHSIGITALQSTHTNTALTLLQFTHTNTALTLLQSTHTNTALTLLQSTHTNTALTLQQFTHTNTALTLLQFTHTNTALTLQQFTHTNTAV